MNKLLNILKEHSGGVFLILLAGIIASAFFLDSPKAQSKNETAVVSESEPKEQILGASNDSSEDLAQPEGNSTELLNKEEDEETSDFSTKDPGNISGDAYYEDLKARLKKYCDSKSYNVKKCSDYLTEAKDARKKGESFRKLYKRYHFEPKEEKKSDLVTTISETKFSLTINSGSSKKYETAASKENSVLDLMELLQKDGSQNFSYHSSSGFIDKINGTESSGNMSWMLYTCKSDVCKLASLGAGDTKIGDWDKIEWKYLDWTTMDWTSW